MWGRLQHRSALMESLFHHVVLLHVQLEGEGREIEKVQRIPSDLCESTNSTTLEPRTFKASGKYPEDGLLQVPHTTMDQFSRPGRCARREII